MNTMLNVGIRYCLLLNKKFIFLVAWNLLNAVFAILEVTCRIITVKVKGVLNPSGNTGIKSFRVSVQLLFEKRNFTTFFMKIAASEVYIWHTVPTCLCRNPGPLFNI